MKMLQREVIRPFVRKEIPVMYTAKSLNKRDPSLCIGLEVSDFGGVNLVGHLTGNHDVSDLIIVPSPASETLHP